MIKKLRRKFMLMIMAVVTLILLAIFIAMLVTTQRNNSRMSEAVLRQAISMRAFPADNQPNSGGRPPQAGANAPNMRLPILVLELDGMGNISVISNQLHFIAEDDMAPIVQLALISGADTGTISEYALRYLRGDAENGVRIAFADISMERDMLRTLVINSLLVGGGAMLVFFLLSIVLAQNAIRPMEIAWERQKQFVANASHELKTPLTVILSNIDMLRKSECAQNEKSASRMEHIHAEAKRMKRLVEDMLTLARSDSAQTSAPYTAVDFSYIVKSAVLMYEPVVYDDSKELSYDIEAGLTVMGDKAGLQQVVHILLDNAQKHSPPCGKVQVGLKKSEPYALLLKVSNSGAPIPQKELERIFLQFYRLDESRSGHGSFGLGLSIAQGIIGEHKGKIWAESDEHSGNHFYVSLPLAYRHGDLQA